MADEQIVMVGGMGGPTDDEIRQLAGDEPKLGEGETANEAEEHEADLEADEERSGRVDEELEGASNDTEREAIRARRRQERVTKRQRAKDHLQTLQRRLDDEKSQRIKMQKQLDELTRTNQSSQIAQLDTAAAQADQVISQLEAAKAAAVAAADGARVVEADRKIEEVRDYRRKIMSAREQSETLAKKPQQQHLDPEMMAHAERFRKDNPWFKGVGAPDEHSRIISSIDAQLTSEGWDPTTPTYWAELRTRGAKYLPDRFKKAVPGAQGGSYNAPNEDGSQGKPSGRSPVAGGSGSGRSGQPGGGGRQSTVVSAARVEAIKAAGRWDNPKEREAMIKSYQQYDKDHGIK